MAMAPAALAALVAEEMAPTQTGESQATNQ
jgi:hypothetical protein